MDKESRDAVVEIKNQLINLVAKLDWLLLRDTAPLLVSPSLGTDQPQKSQPTPVSARTARDNECKDTEFWGSARFGVLFNPKGEANYAWIGIGDSDKSEWAKAFPAVVIDQELAKMSAWLKANPSNRKSNFRRFITNWLTRAQDRAARVGGPTSSVVPQAPALDRQATDSQYERVMAKRRQQEAERMAVRKEIGNAF